MQNITTFDPKQRYIFLPIYVTGKDGTVRNFRALLDTGAPATEFSDETLQVAGFLEEPPKDIALKAGLQTQKYGRVILPNIKICGHPIRNLEVYVSHFEKSWGIKALIGLDFFHRFKVTVDYSRGHIITDPHTAIHSL